MYQDYLFNMSGSASGIAEILVIEPRSWEETFQVIQALRQSKIVILKLNELEPNQAQRAVDFVTGGTYAIDGHAERIGEQTFLFAPKSVQVRNQREYKPPGSLVNNSNSHPT